MKKAVIFDMDGTLFQTEKILERSLTQTLKELDFYLINYIDCPVEKYKEIMGVPLKEVWETLLVNPTDDNIKLSNQIFQNSLILSIQSGAGSLYNHVEEALEDLKTKEYNIFIASNGDKNYLEAIYETYGLQKYITNIYSINEIDTSNKSDLVKYIMEKENIKPIYIVGDRLSDFQAGKDNGAKVIGCKFYFSKEEELRKADYVIESLNELKLIIE